LQPSVRPAAHGEKINLVDGYYRVPLSAQAALALVVILPPDVSYDPAPLLGTPLSLPMGWSESPPYFCAFTETCADLANTVTPLDHQHPFNIPLPAPDVLSQTFHPAAMWPFQSAPPTCPLQYHDIYLDDFMVLAQQPCHTQAMDALLTHLDSIFRDPSFPLDAPSSLSLSCSKVMPPLAPPNASWAGMSSQLR